MTNPITEWRGKWALVTGASAGIGQALASELAAGGSNLVLTARRLDRLDQLARKLRADHGVAVECLAADLERAEAPQEIFAFTRDRGFTIDLLVNNAGFGDNVEFHASALAKQVGMVRVNCEAVVRLTHLYLPGMVERRRGDVLIVASTAAFQPVPYISVYAATKAFDLFFAAGIAEEVKRYGVRVCALCPGATATEFQAVAGSNSNFEKNPETPEKVARTGLKALAAGKRHVVSGFRNWMGVESQRLAPRSLVTSIAEKLFRPEHLK
jgi:short-subunit dehydrogenase